MSEKDRKVRAAARANWTVQKVALEDIPEVEVIDAPPEAMIALCTQLSLQAWALSGRPLPVYTRAEIPLRAIRPGDPKT